MRKLAIAILFLPLVAAAPASADGSSERELGPIQRYGGLWRYQKRDWTDDYGYANPGVCWAWNDRSGAWVWTC